MISISGSVKPVDHHPDARQLTAAIEQGRRKAVYWLISLAALLSLLVGILGFHESVTARTAGTDQLDFAAEGAQSHADVNIGEAIRALSLRH